MDVASTPRLLIFLDACTTWALTPYPRCEVRCVYCITRAQGVSTPLYSGRAAVDALRAELETLDLHAAVAVGAVSDAYPPAEARHGVTRLLIAELIAQRRRFAIITKGLTVCRDVDLLARYAEHCSVQVSLCTLDEVALRRLDPGAPSAGERLAMVRALSEAGLRVSISAAPWIPGVSTAMRLLEEAPAGVTVQFAPLNVDRPVLPGPILGRRWTQAEIDALYLRERDAVGADPRAVWLYPVGVQSSTSRHPFAAMSAP